MGVGGGGVEGCLCVMHDMRVLGVGCLCAMHDMCVLGGGGGSQC
jgi:hypothetical protein